MLGIAVRQERAEARKRDLAPTIAGIQADGYTSLRAIAAELNARNIPTARGEWTAMQVARVMT